MSNSKTGLFLMELIIVILFFSIASAVCVQLFFNGHTTDIQTNKKSHAIVILQNLAECYYGTDSDMQSISEIYDGCTQYDKGVYLLLNDDWDIVTDTISAKYVATLTAYDAPATDRLSHASVSVFEISADSEFNLNELSNYSLILDQSLSNYTQYRKGAY